MDLRIISGRLGKDAEVKETESGKLYLSFSIANDDHTTKDGEKATVWFNCKKYVSENGMKLADWLKKGTMVVVSGLCEERNGDERPTLYLRVDNVTLMGGKKEEKKGGKKKEEKKGGKKKDDDNDVPF